MVRSFILIAEPGPLSSHSESERADKYLHALFQDHENLNHLSRSQIQKLLESGNILVNQKVIRTKDPIPPLAEIKITLPIATPLEAKPENIPLHILYEDEHLLVINKQPGLTVHPSETQHHSTLVNALLYHIKDLSGIGGKLRPGIVHRIDKDTSGALVISKNDRAHAGLAKLFASHTLERKYWALTYGAPKIEKSFRMESTLGRSPHDRKKMAVQVEGGRTAISHFELLKSFALPRKNAFAALVEARLETGRTHQVRVHLNHLGHSLLGDPTYGTPHDTQQKWKNLPRPIQEAVKRLPGQALHARVLAFEHPITGEKLRFEAEPFKEFATLLKLLEEYTFY